MQAQKLNSVYSVNLKEHTFKTTKKKSQRLKKESPRKSPNEPPTSARNDWKGYR